jgi:hypothetical protein
LVECLALPDATRLRMPTGPAAQDDARPDGRLRGVVVINALQLPQLFG